LDFIQASKLHSALLFKHYSCYSDTRGVTTLPTNRNLTLTFGRSSGSYRNSEQSHISSLWQHEVWMARTKKVLTFLSCFFFRVVALLYLEELDCFTSRDMFLLIQDLDWVLGVQQVSLEWSHFRKPRFGHPSVGDRPNCGSSESRGMVIVAPKRELQTVNLGRRLSSSKLHASITRELCRSSRIFEHHNGCGQV
jgi:hypothetical protein